jgi:hypothetical protein
MVCSQYQALLLRYVAAKWAHDTKAAKREKINAARRAMREHKQKCEWCKVSK